MNFKKVDYRFFEMARQQALNSDFDNFHIGCVIVYKNKIIGQGFNSKKTCPDQKKANKYRGFTQGKKPINHSIHAEIAALRSIPYPIKNSINLSKCKVYVYRICNGRKLNMGMARPCSGCIHELRKNGINNIYYTTKDGFAHERIY